MKSILDRSFRYVPSVHTDVRKTFARIRREQRKTSGDGNPAGTGPGMNVVPIKREGSSRKGTGR
jgi:hypothetical protein